MIFLVDKMIHDVRKAIDMNAMDNQLLGEHDIDTMDLDKLIFSKLLDGCRLVIEDAPREKLETGHSFADHELHESSSGRFPYLILPPDFLRLVIFQVEGWERPVIEPISVESPIYYRQYSKFAGIRGNKCRPTCAVVRTEKGKVLEIFGADKNSKILKAEYQPKPKIDNDGGIDIPGELYRSSVMRVAALTLASLGDQLAQTMTEMSNALL